MGDPPPNLQLMSEVLGTVPSNLAIWLILGNKLRKKENSDQFLCFSKNNFKKEKQANKNMCLMQTKTIMKCHFTPSREAIIKKTNDSNCW